MPNLESQSMIFFCGLCFDRDYKGLSDYSADSIHPQHGEGIKGQQFRVFTAVHKLVIASPGRRATVRKSCDIFYL